SVETARLSVAESLGGETAAGFARAFEPREFQFPRDHGPHPEFKTEWWYYTGNLKSASGRRFGYQLTFFRIALSPQAPSRNSEWATNQVYMAHFALSDPDAGQFHHFERFSRGAQRLAGAEAEPFKVWLENWSATSGTPQSLPMQLSAATGEVSIDLQLDSAKPIVLQGDAGLSQKSAEPGNASYYYSLTRMPTVGRISIEGESFAVSGASWLDREWSTSALGKNQLGWDWFSLQLSDGRELMYYQLRLRDGSADPLSSGVLVAADGSSQRLRASDLQIEVLDHWRSPHSGGRYPARWRLLLAAQQLDLEIVPLLADQELQTSVRYWEGAVAVQGRSAAGPVQGYGYVELTGYDSLLDRGD
ncbi:MAG: carotenoid 1,2-hydratase, partial [Deltaproteobacteria bacterium]|nr:carotenoid 1,2-hydratase [Deltaproteobacteria bacterium]